MSAEKKLNLLEASSEESILDVINRAGMVTDADVEKAAKELADRRQQQTSDKIKDIVQRSEFTVKSTHLAYQRSNACNKKIKDYLKDLTDLRNKIVEDKTVSVDDFEPKAKELKTKLDKDLREIGNIYDEAERKLTEYFPSGWQYRYSSLVPGRS